MSQTLLPSVDEIVSSSPAEILNFLEKLLIMLEIEQSSAEACGILHRLASKLESLGENSGHLTFKNLKVPGVSDPIRLILNPAVFSPEFWGRTFAEGLLKNTEHFRGKKIVELGTGSGWISLLLLQRSPVREVLGLDINPVAVTLANINKWLNGSNPDGTLKLALSGEPIVKAFRAEQSDLLQTPLSRDEKFDRIIGCIPQVLHPVPEKNADSPQDLSYQDLYDLSNYCFNQGILEDRFGLPLIARALEEAQLCLNLQGSLTLILGGRPGQQAIEEMFRRRGYSPKLTWVRRIQQADDTDLVQLVNLEEAFGIKFHFFISQESRQSIPASTAVELKKRGEKIFHDLLVYQAETQFEKPTLGFLKNLHALSLDGLRRELDLSRLSEEQIGFLERLSNELLKRRTIPYPHEMGDINFREKLAQFLSFYCHYEAQPDHLFVGPDRQQLLAMILKMVAVSGDKVLLSSSLDPLYGSICRQQGLEPILGNNDLNELLSMDEVFGARICIISPYQLKDPSPLLLDTLIHQAEANPQRCYIIDDSEHFEIGSQIQSNLLLRLLGQRKVPSNLIFLYGLIKNTVCPDFELSFLINAPSEWIHGLQYCAELSYSRISFIVQLYYEWLFDELLSFPFVEANSKIKSNIAKSGIELSKQFEHISSDPVFEEKPISLETNNIVRLDYGEFEWTVPNLLIKGLLKGFLEGRSDSLTDTLQERVAAYVSKTRHASVDSKNIVLGQGVFPLSCSLIQTLNQRLGRPALVAVPKGSYGPVFPMLSYYSANVVTFDTNLSNGFFPRAEDIDALSTKPDLIYISQPANPSGIFLEPENIRKLLKVCAERQIYLFADEIFFLLSDSSLGRWTPAELSFVYNASQEERKYLFMADGLAKAFAAGGLRCGFMLCPDENWATHLRANGAKVPQVVLRAWDRLYSAFLPESPHQLIDGKSEFAEVQEYLDGARSMLTDHRKTLIELLQKHGLSDGLKYARRGGMFLLAKMGAQTDQLAKNKSVLLNSDKWSRSEDWARVCFGVEEKSFELALRQLSDFLSEAEKCGK